MEELWWVHIQTVSASAQLILMVNKASLVFTANLPKTVLQEAMVQKTNLALTAELHRERSLIVNVTA